MLRVQGFPDNYALIALPTAHEQDITTRQNPHVAAYAEWLRDPPGSDAVGRVFQLARLQAQRQTHMIGNAVSAPVGQAVGALCLVAARAAVCFLSSFCR